MLRSWLVMLSTLLLSACGERAVAPDRLDGGAEPSLTPDVAFGPDSGVSVPDSRKKPLNCPAMLTGADSCTVANPGCEWAPFYPSYGAFLCVAPCASDADCPAHQGCDMDVGYCMQRCATFWDCNGLSSDEFYCAADTGICTYGQDPTPPDAGSHG